MDKPVLKDSLLLFEQLGHIKSRLMFGGFGIFVDDVMFALVVNDLLHIRACEKNSKQFDDNNYQPYVYKKRGFPVVTKYFALPAEIWHNTDEILSIAQVALEAAQLEKESTTVEKPCRLKDLPNLRLGTERMLKKAGIMSVADLKQQGAVRAFKALQSIQEDELNIELLWALEGALSGTHWSVVSMKRRGELLASLG